MRTRVVRWGNSLGLRIPKSFAEDLQVGEGSAVDLKLEPGRLVIRVEKPPPIDLGELLAGITEANLHREVDTGRPVGREAW